MRTALIACFLLAGPGVAWAGPLRAGVATVTITPAEPGQYIAGYGANRVSETVHDDIWVRALALNDGEQTVVLAVCDLLGFMYNDALDIRTQVAGVPADCVMLACTHVHSAPDMIGLWGPNPLTTGVDPEYLDFVKAQAIGCLNAAVAAMEPATIGFATGQCPPKTAINVNVPSVNDTAIDVLVVDSVGGERIATLVNWACHPEVLRTESKAITSDLTHYLREEIQAGLGGVALHFNGALGGMVTADCEEHTFEEAERIGRAVGARVCEIAADVGSIAEAEIRAASMSLDVPLDNPRFALAFKSGVIKRDAETVETVQTEVCAFSIGPAQFVTCPGEALPMVGLSAKGMMTGSPTFLLGVTQDELGYILPPEYFGLELYEYECSMSVGPEIGPAVLSAMAELIPALGAPE